MDYSTSYTGGGLLFEVTEALYPLLTSQEADMLLFHEARENKLMKINSESSRIRIIQEVKKRLKHSDKRFWNFYATSSEKEKRLLLFYLCLKTYSLVYDFHFNVSAPRVIGLEMDVDRFKYQMRLDEIASSNAAVAKWSKTTTKKVVTSYIFMMQSAGLSTGSVFNKPDVNTSFYCYFVKIGDLWALDAFFLKTHEKEKLIKDCYDN